MSKLTKVLPLLSILIAVPHFSNAQNVNKTQKTLVDLTGEISLQFKNTPSDEKKGWDEVQVYNKKFRLYFEGAYNNSSPMYIEMDVDPPLGFSLWPDEEKEHYGPYFGETSLNLYGTLKENEYLADYMGCTKPEFSKLIFGCMNQSGCEIYVGRREKKKEDKVVAFIDLDHYGIVKDYCGSE